MSDSETSYFDFYWNGPRGDATEKILALKTTDIQNPRGFRMYYPTWHEELLRIVLEVFYDFADKKLVWKEFFLFLNMSDLIYTRPVLFVAHGLGLFKRLKLFFYGGLDVEEQNDLEYLLPGITLNKRLEVLDVDNGGLVSMGDFRALSRLLETTSILRVLDLNGLTRFDQDLFCQGIAENNTLKQIGLKFSAECDITDECTSCIFTALATHPKLETLDILCNGHLGDLSSDSLQTLLAFSRSLSFLSIANHEIWNAQGKLNPDKILEGLEKNRSLTRLSLSNAVDGNFIFSQFFHAVAEHGSLQRLFLNEKTITKEDLECVTSMSRRKRPIIFELEHSVFDQLSETLGYVLFCHPEIRLLELWNSQKEKISSTYSRYYDLNWHGRYLLDRDEVPLSLWPLVLQKANSKPTVVYEFLKGPAFAAR
jgi:hypothetical protein